MSTGDPWAPSPQFEQWRGCQSCKHLRLDPETDAELRRVASNKGIGPSTLARMWLMEGLSREKSAGGN